ncbi:MAG TPA: nucleoside kinase [Acholeplasmataceae bacterium]|jgi:uridine kinase|nr:nucleoside kinase [Acholeplasmataceae bacterium]
MFVVKVGGVEHRFEDKIILKDLAKQLGIRAYVATVNNRLRELNYYVNYDCEIEFLDLDDFDAVRVYETSLRYLIIMALERLYPEVKVRFSQSVSRSLACHVEGIKGKVDAKFIEQLEAEMRKIVTADYLIERKKLTREEANKIYRAKGYHDKNEVIKYRTEDTVNVYQCEDYINYMFGYMVPSTGYLKDFKLHLYHPSFIVQYPRAELGGKIPPFEDSPSFGRMLRQAQEWSAMCNADTIAHLNRHVEEGTVIELVQMCEMKHNNMLAELGIKIKDEIGNIRLIAIAGPSCSGKTTFSKRLRFELMSRGIRPVQISIDDYYLDREQAPLDAHGNPDLEHIEALDIDLFNEHLLALVQGEEVEIPHFDFRRGRRVPGYKLKVDAETPIIIEGIHALNERLTAAIPKHQKFKIYISPTAQINIDNHNPINASEIRMLRRIVRDAKFRRTPPQDTFLMWASVRRGEFTWIYPYQEEADYIFNSELTYELGVMKKYALPVLESIDRNSEFFIPANRLVKFLKYFKDIDDSYVPCNSLLREFIGGSCILRR